MGWLMTSEDLTSPLGSINKSHSHRRYDVTVS